MELSKDNVAKNNEKTSPKIIAKIHNMPWLKQAIATKDSDRHKAADPKMFNALSNMKENDQTTFGKKKKKQNKNKNKKKSNADALKNSGNNAGKRPNASRDEQLTASSGTQKNVWSDEANGAKVLFPNSSKDISNLSEDEQIKFALEMSKETAMLEKFAIDSSEEDEQQTEKSDSEELDIWVGKHQNLPSPKREALDEDFDTNNNADARKIEDKVASSDGTIITKNEPSNVPPLDVPPTPPIIPKFIDCRGRLEGRSEKHLYMGKGARMKEEQYFKQIQQQKASNGSQQQRYPGYGPPTSYPPRSAPAPMHHNEGFAKGSNDRRSGPPPRPFPQDSQRAKNLHVTQDNSHNENQAGAKQWNDRNRQSLHPQDSHHANNPHVAENSSRNENQEGAKQWNDRNRQNFHPQDSQRPKNSHVAEDNSLKGNQACAKQLNDRNRQNFHPEDSQRPKNPHVVEDNSLKGNQACAKQSNDRNRQPPKNSYGTENNTHNQNQPRGKQWDDRNRQSLPPQDSHRAKYPSHSGDANMRNDNSQRRTGMHAPQHQKPYQSRAYDPSNNPYKFQREPNSRNTMTSDKGDSQKFREVPQNKDDLSNTVANRGSTENESSPLMAAKVEHPSNVVTPAQEPVKQVDRSEIEVHEEAPKKTESNIHQKSQGFSENTKSQLRLSDFNSRDNTFSEQVSLPIDSNSSCSFASSFVNAPSHSFDKNCERLTGPDVCQTNEIKIHPALFSKPPPGFEGSESVTHAVRTPAYVVPVESSLSRSSCAMTAQISTESPQVNKPEDDHVIPISKVDLYARLKITDPMLYELLIKKEKLDGVRENPPMVSHVLKEVPMAQNSSQNDHSLVELPMAQQQHDQNELLNPNAEQFMPNTEQAAMIQPELMAYYSRIANYGPPSMPHQHMCTGLPQEIPSQDNPIWNPSSSNMHYNTEQSSRSVNADVNEGTPTAILGRQNHLVSEKNYPCRNPQGAMHIPQLNDDYHRYQSSGFEKIPMVLPRQVPYGAPCPALFGVAPNQFCSIHCAASYGSQNQASMTNCASCAHPMKSSPSGFQTLEEFVHRYPNMGQGNIIARQVNDGQHHPISSEDCQKYETNSIIPSECYVPTIGKGLPNDNRPSRGRGRMNNRNSKK